MSPVATTPAVRTEGLTKTYGSGEALVRALDDVTVSMAAGELTAIMGPSGSGKSTLMHLTAGLDAATTGRSWIADAEITALPDRALTLIRRERVGCIFQAFNLLPTLDARANICLPLKLAGRPVDADWFDHVVDVLGLAARLTHRPGELSGGQQQRVAAARALITRPTVIFADEPTGALDSAASEQLMGFLRCSVDDLGQTIVMVTHEPAAAAWADRVLRLADGRVVADERR